MSREWTWGETSATALDLVPVQTKAVFYCGFFIPNHNFLRRSVCSCGSETGVLVACSKAEAPAKPQACSEPPGRLSRVCSSSSCPWMCRHMMGGPGHLLCWLLPGPGCCTSRSRAVPPTGPRAQGEEGTHGVLVAHSGAGAPNSWGA